MTTVELMNPYEYTEAECGNCGEVHDIEALNPIVDIQERIAPGEEVPAGECPDPDCGALCHVVRPTPEPTPADLISLDVYKRDDGSLVVHVETDEVPDNGDGPQLTIYLNDDTEDPIWDNRPAVEMRQPIKENT